MKKNISILGSTGSIGLDVLKIIKQNKSKFNVYLLAADKNYVEICKQINNYKPKIFLVNNFPIYLKIKEKYKKRKIQIINDWENLKIAKKNDITIAAIPGIAGLTPTINLIKKSKKILIANKESIICGWNLIQKTAFKFKTKIVPVDSEHYSIMKILENHNIDEVKKIFLTASGGPFLNYKISKLNKVKPNLAIKHPRWKMGKKISIDSATMMNKILEVIEASKLFQINSKHIEIIIHPESLIHAIIQFKNGLYKFIYHETTMLIPLSNAIFGKNFNNDEYFEKKITKEKKFFFRNLNFLNVEKKRYPIINLKDRANECISTPIIINAANEILVDQFLKERISFNTFYKYLLKVLNDRNYRKYAIKEPKNINQILQIDEWSRNTVYKIINKKNA